MLTEVIDGRVVELSPEEEASIRASWAANDSARSKYLSSQKYLDQRNQEISAQISTLINLLFNDIASGTALNSGTFYAAIQSINNQFPKSGVT